jgi:hypothetical protein
MTFEPAVVAAFLSAVAAIASAIAAWRVPISTALAADKLKREGDAKSEERRLKLYVFTTLMQERARVYSLEGVRALNLIDVVFNGSPRVREAWAHLYTGFTGTRVPVHALEERIGVLLKEMAADIGLSDGLRVDDFGRVYFPNALAEEQRIQDLERQQALARLKGDLLPSANVATAEITTIYPPRPQPQNPG